MKESKRTTPILLILSSVVGFTLLFAGATLVGQQKQASEEEKDQSTVRTITATVPGRDWRITASEGPREPASIGSYALRLYVPFDAEWPFDNYVDGEVRVRDGSLEQVLFSDLNNDKIMDVIVVARSAGSGGYLRVDGFLLQAEDISFLHSVDGLASDADPIGSLKSAIEESE